MAPKLLKIFITVSDTIFDYIKLGHQCVSENVIKILGDFGSIFWKKAWAIVQGNFQKFGDLKNGHNSKI